MPGTNVASIMKDGTDLVGATVLCVYAKQPPLYAVYRTKERVVIQFADDEAIASTQRSALAKLNAARGEINGLIDGWRSSRKLRRQADAKRYDRRVADALVIALEGDAADAAPLLAAIKSDIIDARTSWARFQYLTVACITSVCAMAFVACLASSLFNKYVYPIPPAAIDMLPAAGAGTIGAFFSIAIAMRNRTVLTDLHFRDNAADAGLRVVIGLIAAVVLICLVKTKAAAISIGDSSNAVYSTLNPLIIGFLAGFSERLLPDLLAKTAANAMAEQANAPKPPAAAVAANAVVPGAQPAVAAPAAQDHKNPEGLTELTLRDFPLRPSEQTPDSALPATAGGVAALALAQ